MRIFIIIILCCVLKIDFWAQTDHLISKNYYSFSLVSGLNSNTTKVENGEKSPENALSVAHGLNFHYTRIFNPKFSLAAGLGFGFLPINLKVKSFEDFEGTDVFQRGYYSRVNFKGFSRLELLASYHQKINDKFELKYCLGAGLIHYGGYEFSSSGGFQDSTGQYKNIYDVNIKFNNRFKPFVSIGLETNKKLKNLDLVSLKLSYDLSFSTAYTGTYSIYDGNSTGQYLNKGNFLNLSLGYTITGNKKSERLKELQVLNKVDSKTAKKLLKKENRFINPQSSFLAISGGIGVGGTKVSKDPNGILMKYGYPSFLPRISYEKGIKSNFYWELGIHSQLFWNVTKFSFNKYESYGSGVFYAAQLSGGGIYRWILKNNYNVINIHSGVTFGFHTKRNSENGLYSSASGGMNGSINGNPVVFNYYEVSSIKSNILTSLYLGFSKDFRIVNNFYLSLSYRQQFGLYKVFESTYNYNGLNIPTTIGAKTKITGSSKDFLIGFKIKL
jgi:hypothetical protein